MSLAYTFDGHLAAIARQQIVQSEVDSFDPILLNIHTTRYAIPPHFPRMAAEGSNTTVAYDH